MKSSSRITWVGPKSNHRDQRRSHVKTEAETEKMRP